MPTKKTDPADSNTSTVAPPPQPEGASPPASAPKAGNVGPLQEHAGAIRAALDAGDEAALDGAIEDYKARRGGR